MFEITDEFLAQAGFTSLSEEQKTTLKAKVTESVQDKIGGRIVGQIGEERAEELTKLMDGDAQYARTVLASINSDYLNADDFKAIEKLGKANNASDDEIVQEYAVIAWMKHNSIDIAGVIMESMNEAMDELKAVYQRAAEAVKRQS